MTASAAVMEAFRRSQHFVERLETLPFSQAGMLETVWGTLWQRKGKRLRSRLVLWFGELSGVAEERLCVYAWAAEAIHTASLLHDDVIDKSDRRRGGPSANAVFDNTLPVLSGDYLFSDAIERVALEGNGPILRGLCNTVKALAQGECLQYSQRWQVPAGEQELERINALKTSSLLRWSARVGPTLAPGIPLAAVDEFIAHFGRLYQYTDDLLDVFGTPTKPRWSDLKEGKINWATWRMVTADNYLRRLVERDFARRGVTPQTVGAFERAATGRLRKSLHESLEELALRTQAFLNPLPFGLTRDALRGLVGLCVERTH